MKALKSKIILSAAVLFFALVATVGSTFAWFTVDSTNNVVSMTLNVQSADSLLIKVANPADPTGAASDLTVASTYYTTITTAMITSAYSLSAWRLEPVTAVQPDYATVSGELASLQEFTNNLNPLRALDAIEAGTFGTGNWGVDVNAASGKVIQIGFWVMSQASTTKNVGVTALSITANNAIAARDQVTDAARVSFKLGEDSAFIYANTGALDYDYEYLINLPGYYAGAVYNTSPVELLGFNRIDQLTAGLNGSSTALTDELLEGLSVHRTAGSAVLGDLVADTAELLTITIFVEGWDAQATNTVISAAFNVSFSIGFVA
jgi:hypothetical protein